VAATAPAGSQVAQIAAASQAVASAVATPAADQKQEEKPKEAISPASVTIETAA
jgi:hypothetical protein